MVDKSSGDNPMLELFLVDMGEVVGVLQDAISADGDDFKAYIETLSHGVHSLTGAAKIIGVEIVMRFVQALENYLIAFKDGDITFDRKHRDVLTGVMKILEKFTQGKSSKFYDVVSNNSIDIEKSLDMMSEERKPEENINAELLSENLVPKSEVKPFSEEADASMIELFKAEAETQLEVLNKGLLALEENAGDVEQFEPMMRAAHSLKGAARVIQLDQIVNISHVIEDCFEAAREGKLSFKPEDFDTLFKGIDMLGKIVENIEGDLGSWLEEYDTEIVGIVLEISAIASGANQKAKPDVEKIETVVPEVCEEGIDIDASIFDLFKSEAETQVAVLNDALMVLENDLINAEQFDIMMRASHALKGAARAVHLNIVAEVADIIERCFAMAQEGRVSFDASFIDAMFKGVDMLSSMSMVPLDKIVSWMKIHNEGIRKIIAEISAMLSKGKSVDGLEKRVVTAEGGKKGKITAQLSKAKSVAHVLLKQKGGKGVDRAVDHILRVTVEHVDKLMGLAGEAMVESRWLQPFSNSLMKLKNAQFQVAKGIDSVQDTLSEVVLDKGSGEGVKDLYGKMTACRQMLADCQADLELFSRRSVNLSERLYRAAISTRMRPFSDGVHGIPRMVRDVAKRLNKKVKFTIEGETTDVDRDILDKLESPLNHLLRNSIDHGIEPPEERTMLGKPEHGTIHLEARHRAGALTITISDDGRGVDIEKLRKRIVERDMVTEDMAENLSDAELLDFLFLPGFSTASEVTEISGRGVGMDVVYNMVQEVGGMVRATTTLGKGMKCRLHLPLTRSVIRALLVKIGGEPYAFPLIRVERAMTIGKEDINEVENQQYFTLGTQNVALIPATQVLEVDTGPLLGEDLSAILVADNLNRYAVVVDEFSGEHEFVIQELSTSLGKVSDISSAAVMEDGTPVLIIDVNDMINSINKILSRKTMEHVVVKKLGKIIKRKRILVVDDSPTVREVEIRLLRSYGYEVEFAVDGMDGWNAVRVGDYDLVVSDIDMPRMNGLELVGMIKSNPKFEHIPVVIVSYKDRVEDRERGEDVGADCYLTKSSFQDETFIDTITKFIGTAEEEMEK